MFARLSTSITTETTTIDGTYYIARIMPDDNADMSYLDQEGWEERKRQCEEEGVYSVGIVVTAYDDADREIGGASLWGIESDSGAEYLRQVANELIEEVA